MTGIPLSKSRAERGGRPNVFCRLAVFVLLTVTSTAYGHSEEGVADGLVSGLLHPVLGFDHLVAMVAVGLWGAQLGRPAVWLLPIAFPLIMACGALIGIADIPLPFVEYGIAASALVLGVMVALRLRPPMWLATTLVGAFGIFHGHAHGAEIPAAVNPLSYGVGFVVSTGCLHLLGILIGLLIRWPSGERVVRACGAAVATVGVFTLAVNLGLLA